MLCEEKERRERERERWRGQGRGFDVYNQHIMDVYIYIKRQHLHMDLPTTLTTSYVWAVRRTIHVVSIPQHSDRVSRRGIDRQSRGVVQSNLWFSHKLFSELNFFLSAEISHTPDQTQGTRLEEKSGWHKLHRTEILTNELAQSGQVRLALSKVVVCLLYGYVYCCCCLLLLVWDVTLCTSAVCA